MNLGGEQIERYARHIMLPEIGGAGQARLLASRVLLVGAGGLGSPLALYLAAAGVGTIGIVDDDVVSLSNLQRQIAHKTRDIGRPKTDSAAESIGHINPDVKVVRHQVRLNVENVRALIGDYDLIADGCDNFPTKFLLNDACYLMQKPLVAAALGRFEGQLSTFRAYEGEKPCYRCIFPEPPPPGSVPNCAEAGTLGLVAGVMGTLQGIEVVKELLGIGASMTGQLLIYDALDTTFRKIRVRRDPQCRLCGTQAVITSLADNEYIPR
ncbi:MAG: molybdopterin-synthase adenylyltransferase MoeB [Alphaproteobacteria bacterium]|nr:molybdopterin-synthase adenylyltransferase MoeB [Alphaproteobacteria bacterium]